MGDGGEYSVDVLVGGSGGVGDCALAGEVDAEEDDLGVGLPVGVSGSDLDGELSLQGHIARVGQLASADNKPLRQALAGVGDCPLRLLGREGEKVVEVVDDGVTGETQLD